MRLFSSILLFLWQLPQNLLGLLLLLFLVGEQKHRIKNIDFYYAKSFSGGISLGQYIILGHENEKSVRHEYGHCVQSKILGPLYLLIIGMPSIVHAWLHESQCIGKSYYHFWTESWANRIVGLPTNMPENA